MGVGLVVEADIESVTILVAGRRGSVTLEQTQPAVTVQRFGVKPLWRSGEELLEAAVVDARAWLAANGGGR